MSDASRRRATILTELARLHAEAMRLVADLAAIDAAEQERAIREAVESENRRLEAERAAQAAQAAQRPDVLLRLPERLPTDEPIPGIENVTAAVCSFYRVTTTELVGEERYAKLVRARHVAFYLCRKLATRRPSFPSIGRAFGDRDHTTVMSGIKKIEHERTVDQRLDAELDALAQRIGLALPHGA